MSLIFRQQPSRPIARLHADARNIQLMSVTLDVSKLSGWSNADAYQNMKLMSVTLDVSTLSGWLKAEAE